MSTKENQNADAEVTAKGKLASGQEKPDAKSVATVTPDNDNGNPGAPAKDSSNKGKGPKGENL